MNFTSHNKPAKKLEDLLKNPKLITSLNQAEQQNTKGGCNCNEKRIRRVYYTYTYKVSSSSYVVM